MAARRRRGTPIREALQTDSALQQSVQDGIGAMKSSHHDCLAQEVRSAFADSLDLDAAMQEAHAEENRWDYVLGHTASTKLVGVEPHSAKQDQVATVIKKREAAKRQLADHLKPGKRVSRWLWVASGTVHFADTETARLRLDQSGIEFVGRQVRAGHLP